MFKLCHSIQIVTQHNHYYQRQVSLARKNRHIHQQATPLVTSTILPKPHHPQPSLRFYQSIYSCPETNHHCTRRTGIQILSRQTPRHTQPLTNYQIQKQSLVNYHLTTQEDYAQNTWQGLVNQQKMEYFRGSSHSPQKVAGNYLSSNHKPHPLIRKKKSSIPTFETIAHITMQKEITYQRDFKQIKGSTSNSSKKQPKKQSMTLANEQCNLQRTRKKEPKYNPRHSQETSLNLHSQIKASEETDLRELEMESDPPSITIHPCERAGGLKDLGIPRKLKKQLEDAKSIISRDESSSHFQDVKLEESILLKREIDMFDFITPVQEIKICEMAKAVDRRDNALVTLKIFREEEAPYRQLQILRKIQLGRAHISLRVLKFHEIFMEDAFAEKEDDFAQKKVIFVFEAFQKTLGEHIACIRLNARETIQFLESLQEQMIDFLDQLFNLDLEVVCPLHLDDFVMTQEGWKFHNLSKLSSLRSHEPKRDTSLMLNSLKGEIESFGFCP